jgi:hypothetical protein
MSVRRLPNIENRQACDVCGRTMLKGEDAEPYLTPSRERKMVCQLCGARAQQEGWIREAAAPETPARPQRTDDRRRLLRFGRRREQPGREHPAGPADTPADTPAEAGYSPDGGAETSNGDPGGEAPRSPFRRKRAGPRSPRHVRAVPTNSQLKIDRALDLFNDSEHRRTVGGIIRSLGPPQASAATSPVSAAQVLVTVAWELSWYQFVVDLSDPREPVQVRGQGQEVEELPEQARQWNLEVSEAGALGRDDPAAEETVEPERVE